MSAAAPNLSSSSLTISTESTYSAFVSLPPEILLQIFLHLTHDRSSLLAVQLTCHYLDNLISGSSQLQYEAALASTHQIDNPYLGEDRRKLSMPVKDKLDWLRETSRRWSVLDMGTDFERGISPDPGGWMDYTQSEERRVREIKVNHLPSGIYDLTGGVYVLGDLPRKTLYWVKLPGKEEIENDIQLKWNKLDLDELKKRPESDGRHRTIIDMGLSIHEHDLIVIVTLSPQPTSDGSPPTVNDIDLVLLQFSTGQPHPALAQSQGAGPHYIRHITSSPTAWHRPAIGIEIVGEHLVLVLYYHEASVEDRVFVWEWKTGVLKMSLTVPHGTYSGLILLTPFLILLPNTQTNSLDIFRIPSKPTDTPLGPLLSLDLPTLGAGRSLLGISCRAEPNPITSTSSSAFASRTSASQAASSSAADTTWANPSPDTDPIDLTPTRPFLPDAEHALCIFSLRVLGDDFVTHPFGHPFTMVVHRSALVNIVKQEVPGYDREANEASEKGDNVGSQAEAVPEANGGTNGADDEPAMPGSFTSYTRYSTHGRRHKVLPYAVWGPPITRWFDSDSIPTRWITTTCGQRLVLTADTDDGLAMTTGFPYIVLDFCQDNVKKMGENIKIESAKELRRKEAADRQKREKMREKLVWRESEPDGWPRESKEEDADMWLSGHQSSVGRTDSSDQNGQLAGVAEPSSSSPPSPSALYHELWELHDRGQPHEMDYEPEADDNGDLANASTSAQMVPTLEGLSIEGGPGDEDEMDVDQEFEERPEDEENDFDFDNLPSSSSHQPGQTMIYGSQPTEDEDGDEVDTRGKPSLPLNRLWHVTNCEPLEPSEMFAEPVEGRLPYVACASERRHWFEGVLIDEERVVGITTDSSNRVKEIEIHYYG